LTAALQHRLAAAPWDCSTAAPQDRSTICDYSTAALHNRSTSFLEYLMPLTSNLEPQALLRPQHQLILALKLLTFLLRITPYLRIPPF